MIHTTNFVIMCVLIKNIPYFYQKFKKYSDKNCYYYEYKNCCFQYYLTSCCLCICTNTHKILGKTTITESDLQEFISKLKSIIEEVITIRDYDLNLTRIDYMVDIKSSSNEEKKEIVTILHKYSSNYKRMTQKQKYETSCHLSTKSSNLNFYDKEQQMLDVFGYAGKEYKNIVRLELQIKAPKIKRLCRKKEVPRDIKNYFTKEAMEEYYFKFLRPYFYQYDYIKISNAIDIIRKSSYTQTIKLNLIKFLKVVDMVGMTNTKKYFCYNAVTKYLDLLNKLELNPICLSDSSKFDRITNLLDQAKEVAQKNYFK